MRSLRFRDVDFTHRLVHVRRSVSAGQEDTPQSGKAHSVPLIDQAATALDRLSRRPHFTGRDDFVFARGTNQDEKAMRDGLCDAMEKAEIVATAAPASRSGTELGETHGSEGP